MTLEYGSQVYDYRIVSGLTEGQHTVKVLKRTEDLVTRMSLHKLATDGYFIEKQPDNRLKMEVYGDSITCGYGNLRGALSDTTSSAYQDGLETYATLAAFTLDADINVFARSGGGLYTCYGYTTGTNSLVKDNFTKTDYQGTYPWNMSYFTPDVVIINIGTNDYWWPSTATGSDIWGNSYHGNYNDATFKAEYVAFVKQLVSYYGNNTSFILCSGFMESAVDSRVQDIQTTLQSEITNTVLRHQFAQCGEGHPKVHEHAVGAAEIVNLIRDNNLDTPVNTQTTNMTEFDGESSGKYSISAHSNSSSIVSVSDNSITIHNENWMAGFVLDSTNRGSTFNMTMNIGAASQSSYVANVVYGVLPYYIDDDNYIIVYLQFSSATKMKNIGCTGRIDGKDTGWLDFFGINDIVINDWTDFGEISINREYNRLNVKYGGKVQNKYIPGMVKSSEKTGYYACSEVDASFTNIEYGEIKELIPDPVAPVYPTTTYEYVGSGSMDIDGDDVVLHNGTWKDAFALRTLSLGTSYTFSATITANKDEFTTADDAMFGIVLNYESASEYTLLMINFGDYTGKVGNKVRCITILDWYDGVDHWADFWTFQGKETHFTTGETLTVVKNGGSITATFAGTTETVSLPHIADASALTAGFYSQKTGYTRYSNISWTH